MTSMHILSNNERHAIETVEVFWHHIHTQIEVLQLLLYKGHLV